MPQVTIKCKWCGEDYSADHTTCITSDGAIRLCEQHECVCGKNPANKKPTIMTAIYTGKAEFIPVYVPTDEDKRLAGDLVGMIKHPVWTSYAIKTNQPYLVASDYVDLFKRLGLME